MADPVRSRRQRCRGLCVPTVAGGVQTKGPAGAGRIMNRFSFRAQRVQTIATRLSQRPPRQPPEPSFGIAPVISSRSTPWKEAAAL